MEMLKQQSVAVINVTRDEHCACDVTAESERGAVVVRCNCYNRTGGSRQSFSDCDSSLHQLAQLHHAKVGANRSIPLT